MIIVVFTLTIWVHEFLIEGGHVIYWDESLRQNFVTTLRGVKDEIKV